MMHDDNDQFRVGNPTCEFDQYKVNIELHLVQNPCVPKKKNKTTHTMYNICEWIRSGHKHGQ
jgi:hypothetical protein